MQKEQAISKWKIKSVQDDFEYMANGSGKVVRWQGVRVEKIRIKDKLESIAPK